MNQTVISWCPLISGLCPCSCIDSWSKVKPCCPEHPFDWLKVHMYSTQWPTWLRYVRVRLTEWPGHLVNFSIRQNDCIVQQKYTSHVCENGLWYWMHLPYHEMINDAKNIINLVLILTTLPTSVADFIWMQLLQYTFHCLMVTLCFSTLTGDYIESQ